MKRLKKANNSTIDSLANWIENCIPISNSEYEQLLKEYKISGKFYRVLGFEMDDIERAIETYYDVDLYDDNSGIKTTKTEFLNCMKTLVKQDNRICSWTKYLDSVDQLVNDLSNSSGIIILISAQVEGIDINKIVDDYEDQLGYILYNYQNEVLGTQKSDSNVICVFLGGSHWQLNIPQNGNLNEYINMFE